MAETDIEYVDRSVNPVRARLKIKPPGMTARGIGHYCEKVSAGCAKCYSSARQPRFGLPTFGQARLNPNIEVYFDPSVLDECLRRRIPTRWFPFDMTDAWGAWVEDEWLDYFFAVAALTPQHTYVFPTKRPERMRTYLTADGIGRVGYVEGLAKRIVRSRAKSERPVFVGQTLRWPLPNVHLGVSVEDQATADQRIPLLLQTPAAVRWVSYEPAIGAGDFAKFLPHALGGCCSSSHEPPDTACTDFLAGQSGNCVYCDHEEKCHPGPGATCEIGGGATPRLGWLDWIVCGGESGPGARPFDLAWARSTIAQCRAAGAPVFVKQLGAQPIDRATPPSGHEEGAPIRWRLRDRKGGDWTEWPEDIRVRELP